MIRSGDLTLFDSGAILLYLADGTPLLPANQRPQLTQWVFAALNTVEMASGFWTRMILAQRIPEAFGPPPGPEVVEHARRGMNGRFDALERLMSQRDWIAGDFFSVADILMVDVLRVPEAEGALADYPALAAYVARATARHAFGKAMADHMAHWLAADAARVAGESA